MVITTSVSLLLFALCAYTAYAYLDENSAVKKDILAERGLGSASVGTSSCLCLTGYRVNVRSAPSLSGSVLGQASVGQCLMALQSSPTYANGYYWYKVRYNNRDAYIVGNYLSNKDRLSHSEAKSMIDPYGIPISSSGGCTNRYVTSCTSLDTIKCGCMTGLIALRRYSGCTGIRLTGGTEKGHSTRILQSHWNGYKLDIGLDSCVDSYIQRNFPYIGRRGDGAAQYRASSGNIYAKESNHWDIKYNV